MELLLAAFISYISQYFFIGLVWIVAIVLALSRWRQHPRVSRLTLAAILIFLADSIVGPFTGFFLPSMLHESSPGIGIPSLYYSFLGLLSSVVQAVGWSLIIAAVFSQREKA